MIRGFIEYIDEGHVGGWIYSPDLKVSGRRVLAFLDDKCVGAGEVERQRPDLEQVGFGSDPLGFHFPIAAITNEDAQRIYVRVDDSDFVLIGNRARIAGRDDGERLSSGEAQRLAGRVEWFYREKVIGVEERYILSRFLEDGIALVSQDSLDEIAAQRGKSTPAEAMAVLLTFLTRQEVVAEALDDEADQAEDRSAPVALFGRFPEGTKVEAAIGSHVEQEVADSLSGFTSLEASGKCALFHPGLAFRENPVGTDLHDAMILVETE